MIGAGIVGVCCALYLQRAGRQVVLIDPAAPGSEASRSNAGIITSGDVVPIGTPGVLRRVPRMLLDPLAPLTIRPTYLPRIAPWLARFILSSRPARVEQISVALGRLVADGIASYEPLIADAGAEFLIRREGLLYIYQADKAFEGATRSLDLKRRRGVEFRILDPGEVARMEPSIASVRRAVHYPKTLYTVDPGRFVETLARHFQDRGGALAREAVTGFRLDRSGPTAVLTDRGSHPSDAVVVAAGAWSRELALQLGTRVPLDTERGYVMMLPDPGVSPRVAMISGDHHVAITPMADGLRLSGTVEFAGLRAPANPARADKLGRASGHIFPEVNLTGATWWMSHRPSMPDSLPVIARSPRYRNVFFAFGHGHNGLGFAAITGKLISELAGGRETSVDVTPFSVQRFRGSSWVWSRG